jgi:hypothetical protein
MPEFPDFSSFSPIPPQPATPSEAEEANAWWLWQMLSLPGRIDSKELDARIVQIYEEAGKFHLVTSPDPADLKESYGVCTIYHDNIVSNVISAALAHPTVFEGYRVQDLLGIVQDQPALDDLENAHRTVGQYLSDTRTLRKGIAWRLALPMIRSITDRAEAAMRTGNPDAELVTVFRKIQQALEKRQEHIDTAKDKTRREDREKEELRAQNAALQAELRQLRASMGNPTPPTPTPTPMPNPAPDAPRPPGPAAHGRRLDR